MNGWQASFLTWYLGGKLDRQSKAKEPVREKAEREARFAEAEARSNERWAKWEAGIEDEAPKPVFQNGREKLKAVLAGIFIFGNLGIALLCLVALQFLLAPLFVFIALLPLLLAKK